MNTLFLSESLSSTQPKYVPITVGELAESALAVADACYEMSVMNEALLGADFVYSGQLSESSDEGEKKSVLKKIIDKLKEWLKAVGKFLKKVRDYIKNLFRRIFGIKPKKQPATTPAASTAGKTQTLPATKGTTDITITGDYSSDTGSVTPIAGSGVGDDDIYSNGVGRVRPKAIGHTPRIGQKGSTSNLPAPTNGVVTQETGIRINVALLRVVLEYLRRLDKYNLAVLSRPLSPKILEGVLNSIDVASASQEITRSTAELKQAVANATQNPVYEVVKDLKSNALLAEITKRGDTVMESFSFADNATRMLSSNGEVLRNEDLAKIRAVSQLLSSVVANQMNLIGQCALKAVE